MVIFKFQELIDNVFHQYMVKTIKPNDMFDTIK